MNETTTTEQAAPDPLDAEARARADAWEAQRVQALKMEMHARWGWSDRDLAAGLDRVAYTKSRLGISDDEVAGYVSFLGSEAAVLEHGAARAYKLARLPSDMTPDRAREVMQHDHALRERVGAGDRTAIEIWDALNELQTRRTE